MEERKNNIWNLCYHDKVLTFTLIGRSLEQPLNELPIYEAVIYSQYMELRFCCHSHLHRFLKQSKTQNCEESVEEKEKKMVFFYLDLCCGYG